MLQIKNIVKSFPGVFEKVLKGVDLSLGKGEFCVVIGANGSGKSTLMKIIGGEYTADSGSITRSGLVSQVVQDVSKGTIPTLTLLENFALSQMRYKKPRFSSYKRYKNEAVRIMKTAGIGLEKYINQPLGSLSGGQRQIVATMMAINSGGQILLLDEHTSALDPKMQSTLMKYTAKSIKEKNLTALMITHKMDDAIKYGDRLIMLNKGRIVMDIKGQEKTKLSIQDLLEKFHKFEDQDILENKNDN
ncbi:MAG: ATP-binding cassette domain-containing protein [Holosporales bacterium]|jgi:putative ABC transport system ATP-binding protein|nr:ATP-binding cassette domain-containing protein [Holosporales bacterium]